MESIFIEFDKNVFSTKSNIILGLIYRMPDSPIEVFNIRMDSILNTIRREKKICYFLGDLNICFLKSESHRLTSEFIDLIYSYGVFPLISKPTRVTKTSATLIDHILTNNFDTNSHHKQGILCSSISDHYSVFHIARNTQESASENSLPLVLRRNITQRNIQRFISEIRNISWQDVMDLNDVQTAYGRFQLKISKVYDLCFPLKPMRKQYFNNKPWLTIALKESIKIKNKLYVNRHKGNNPDNNLIEYKRWQPIAILNDLIFENKHQK